jgi:hypothetical protein
LRPKYHVNETTKISCATKNVKLKGAIHEWGTKTSFYHNTDESGQLNIVGVLNSYYGSCFGSYLHLIFHKQYNDKVNLQGLGLSKILL